MMGQSRIMHASTWIAKLAFVFVVLCGVLFAQSADTNSNPSDLKQQIAAQDQALFHAFNTCDLDRVETFFLPDLEFYHEKGGLILTAKNAVNVMRKSLCGKDSNKVRRELVVGSLAVFPINDFGAIQTGEHRFYLTQKGQPEALDGIGQFIHIWKLQDGQWKISRIVSYGFRKP